MADFFLHNLDAIAYIWAVGLLCLIGWGIYLGIKQK